MKLFLAAILLSGACYATSQDELNKLTDNFSADVSHYFTKEQLLKIFSYFNDIYKSDISIREGAIDIYKKMKDECVTSEQRVQIMETIREIAEKLGGPEQFKVAINKYVDSFAQFFDNQLKTDREEIQKMKTENKPEEDINSFAFTNFQKYFSKEHVQKVFDAVKCPNGEQNWAAFTAEAPTYMNVENFNLAYNC